MRIKVSDYVVQRLAKEGVNTIFGYQGGNISHLIDSIGRSGDIQYVETYHEQGAAFAANAYAQINETIGVAVASSGPGAINLLNGIANAFCDSIPCIFFTGDVNTTAKNPRGSQRQNAFQEINILPMVEPITKYCVSVDHESKIKEELDKALSIAESGRKGPVLINLPHDIQRNYIDTDEISVCTPQEHEALEINLEEIVNLLKKSKRPLLLVGGGLKGYMGTCLIKRLLEKVQIPVVCSMLGMDVLPHNHFCYRGVIGSYGQRGANLCLQNADLILVLGSRLDDRQIAVSDAQKLSNTNIVHVDIDEHELGLKLHNSIRVKADVFNFLRQFIELELSGYSYNDWMLASKQLCIQFNKRESDKGMHPNDFLDLVSREIQGVFTFDVGNNQMHSAQSVYVKEGSHILTSGGLGSMGYSLPAAVGASYANGVNKVICISGDGGLQMNIQEMQSISYHNLPVNIVLLNNNALGMIYHLQTKMFKDRFYGTTEGYAAPDFSAISKAYGFMYMQVNSVEQYANAIKLMKSENRVFIDFKMDVNTTTRPDIGAGTFEQMPALLETEVKKINKLLNNEKD